jgi:diguanylate cyclase (GGDEF)-like protein
MGAVCGLLLLIAIVGWLDYITGPEVGFSLFYLLPILAAAWWLGGTEALVVAAVGSVAWFLADESLHPPGHIPVSIWNAFTRLTIFSLVGLLVARVRGHRDRLEELLERERRLGRVDAMTELPNRRGFVERLMLEASRCRRTGQPICVAYLDLDNFKTINDRYGHVVGDELLSRFGRSLKAAIRAGDMAARLGGDEFAVLFWDADRGAVEAIARRIIESVNEAGRNFPGVGLGASVGIAYFERVPDSVEEILQRADRAMYEAKAQGKGRLVIWRSGPSPMQPQP